ncbi:GNAT family N-acetyltransferase [Alkaliphilus pronyensis]|uniref:GNAT family N-acetyltransferase n=1 Tax=Alkaliphilus pronyensis TaxID=1482732 RepID=A0A6I0F0B0_9FIRM|nr:GNAT family N-acetyltransferase [Alkaliphilus pronyensis]KAB3534005.1 GNAT family N-acetyltransferase [Alkaliphilus pronyensis]
MLEIRRAVTEDIQQINEIYRELSFNELAPEQEDLSSIIVKEGNKVLGISNYKRLSVEAAEISFLYITPNARGNSLGDGLLRGTLNYLMEKGYSHIFLRSNKKLEDFYTHEGLLPLTSHLLSEELQLQLKNLSLNTSDYFYCYPKDFFQKKCKGSR